MNHSYLTDPNTSSLSLSGLGKRFGSAVAVENLTLDVANGEFVTLLGPSGCGKTTTIRMVAGYVAPTTGRVLLRSRDVTIMPPQRRGMGMVFQDYALFPHLSVRDNVAFGLRMRGVSKRTRRGVAEEKLELVGLREAADKLPAELSGGMRQRVALARALAIDPAVLLLDEPFSALDAKLRSSLRGEVKRIQQVTGVTTLLVTHDQQEALSLSDRVVVMRDGGVEQVGTPREIYERPSSLFALDFVGRSTRFSGTVVRREGANQLVCDVGGATVHACDPGSVQPGERVTLAIRPESVAVSVAGDREGQANVFTGVLAAREYGGGVEHVTVDVAELGASVLCEVAARGECRPSDGSVGDPVGVCFRREDVIVVADGGAVSSDGDGVAPGLPAATVA